MPGNRLQDRVAVITGSSSGLGRAIALAYSNEGAKIVCADLNPSPRAELESEAKEKPTHETIVSNGREAIFVKCNVGESGEVANLISEAVRKYGRIDM